MTFVNVSKHVAIVAIDKMLAELVSPIDRMSMKFINLYDYERKVYLVADNFEVYLVAKYFQSPSLFFSPVYNLTIELRGWIRKSNSTVELKDSKEDHDSTENTKAIALIFEMMHLNTYCEILLYKFRYWCQYKEDVVREKYFFFIQPTLSFVYVYGYNFNSCLMITERHSFNKYEIRKRSLYKYNDFLLYYFTEFNYFNCFERVLEQSFTVQVQVRVQEVLVHNSKRIFLLLMNTSCTGLLRLIQSFFLTNTYNINLGITSLIIAPNCTFHKQIFRFDEAGTTNLPHKSRTLIHAMRKCEKNRNRRGGSKRKKKKEEKLQVEHLKKMSGINQCYNSLIFLSILPISSCKSRYDMSSFVICTKMFHSGKGGTIKYESAARYKSIATTRYKSIAIGKQIFRLGKGVRRSTNIIICK